MHPTRKNILCLPQNLSPQRRSNASNIVVPASGGIALAAIMESFCIFSHPSKASHGAKKNLLRRDLYYS